jgi:NAD-dependent dihydropyrimidine dehydrogenase PreA subunit
MNDNENIEFLNYGHETCIPKRTIVQENMKGLFLLMRSTKGKIDRVVFCKCNSEILSEEYAGSIERVISKKNTEVILCDDLCNIAVSDRSKLDFITDPKENLLVIACHERAVHSLLGIPRNGKEEISFFNFREKSIDDLKRLLSVVDEAEGNTEVRNITGDTNWVSWYPVIDEHRCTNCGQCSEFCLFEVYTIKHKKVVVSNPRACKNNCPACARICPQVALIFPKYREGGAISGADSISEEVEANRLQQDMHTILGADIYKALERRKKRRQSILKKNAMRKAHEERENALSELSRKSN